MRDRSARGPTEAIVLASTGNARWIAADLLAQAEHAPDAGSYLVTTSASLARQVQTEVARQLQQLRQRTRASFDKTHKRNLSRRPSKPPANS